MPVEITIPSPGESITEVVLGPWQKSDGDWVEKDEPLVEIESDKVTLEVPAPESGVLSINADEGAEMKVGDVIGLIDPDAQAPSRDGQDQRGESVGAADESAKATTEPRAATAEEKGEAGDGQFRATTVARKLADERGVNLQNLKGTGPSGRITKSDVMAASDRTKEPAKEKSGQVKAVPPSPAGSRTPLVRGFVPGSREIRRQKMSKLRQKIAQRLVTAQHTAAMLTTFNEADMSEVMRLRDTHKEAFENRHGVGLGFMSFFVKACVLALQKYERVNAYIVNDEVEYHDFVDVSIAVGTDRGLVVPVLRNAEAMTFAEVERSIRELAAKARDGKLSLDDMTGGTFTISNGGVYGSLLSTPILNPPQSGILGMHKIMKRPVEDPHNSGHIVLRPMMYLALSYDHRIVDGAEAVGFLVHLKNSIENPERLLLDL